MNLKRFLSSVLTASTILGLAACSDEGAGTTQPVVSVVDASTDAATTSYLSLPDANYYPESLFASANGTVFVGSLGQGRVMKIAPGSATPTDVIPANGVLKQTLGVFVDNATNTLFVCDADTSPVNARASTMRSYDAATGEAKTTYSFPTPAFCNDLTMDDRRNLYIADSFGKIYVLADGASNLAVWSDNPLLAPSKPGGFGADGIAFDGRSNIYVNTFSDGRVLRIPILSDGSAGSASELRLSAPLAGPDGMRMLDPSTLVMVEQNAGRLTTVSTTDGTVNVLRTGLNLPTSVVVQNGEFLVTEGQLGHFLGLIPGPPSLPFKVQRIAR